MELQHIVDRYAEAIQVIDADPIFVAKPRKNLTYPSSMKAMTEPEVVRHVDAAWATHHPGEFLDPDVKRTGVAYPTLSRTNCDHVFTTDSLQSLPEWALEVKHPALIGSNGKRNDFTTAKMLSPFLKDRSLLHDVARLRAYPLARRHAVVGYAFIYDQASCDEAAKRHPMETSVIDEIRSVCDLNGGALDIRPLLDFAEAIIGMRGMLAAPRSQAHFEAWGHPAGGRGVVFGFEVRRPELDPGYDPRHPW